jgi:hypothetical protein
VSARLTALVAGFVAIALVLAQDVAPGAAFYHSWQYALALAVALALMAGYAAGAWRGHDGPVGRRLVLALAGLAVVDLAGLASGLLGPDTATIVGTPGTVAPIPVLGAAAFFAPADADALARGAGSVVLRRRGHSAIELGVGTRRLLGDSVVSLTPRPALYVEAWDARGAHLTVTQPAGTAFLSPVLQFGTRQRITDALTVPVDGFATPAQHRSFRALYFSPRDLAGFPHRIGDPSRPAVILTVADDAGRPLGIALSQGGRLALGGVTLRLTLGTYPALAIASAPDPVALALGLGAFVLGLIWVAALTRLRRRARVAHAG